MTVDVADVEAQVVTELVTELGDAAKQQVAAWEYPGNPLTRARTIVELWTWTARADVVAPALTALDERWRLALGVVAAVQASGDLPPISLSDLFAIAAHTQAELRVVGVAPGSLRTWLRTDPAKRPLIAALLVFVSLSGLNAQDAVKATANRGHGREHCEFVYRGELSDEAREFLNARLSQLPPGCFITIEQRAGTRKRSLRAVARIPPDASAIRADRPAVGGVTKKSKKKLRRAMASGDADAANELGLLHEAEGDTKAAMNAFRRADRRGSAEGALNVSRLSSLEGNLEAAAAAFDRARVRTGSDT